MRVYLGNFITDRSVLRHQGMFVYSPWVTAFYLGWFVLAVIMVSRRLHLYAPIQLRNTLHDQRLTIQACFTAGLLLSGALFLSEIVATDAQITQLLSQTIQQ